MLDGEFVIHGTEGSISKKLLDHIRDSAPRCDLCEKEPVACTLTVRRLDGELVKTVAVCMTCLVKEL